MVSGDDVPRLVQTIQNIFCDVKCRISSEVGNVAGDDYKFQTGICIDIMNGSAQVFFRIVASDMNIRNVRKFEGRLGERNSCTKYE
jgi:hypothetical protein